jgi:aminoglycoside phosphotransferase (APT) family kinase protein
MVEPMTLPIADDPQTDRVVAWLQSSLGGRVLSLSRQARWRPVWMVDLERDDEQLPLCVRGDRIDTQYTWSLEHEMRFQRTLQEQGVPVPKVYGWIDEPRAIVMDRVPGRPDFAGSTDVERDVVVDEYLQMLARMHALDVAPFVEAGIDRADRPEESGVLGARRMVAMYRAQKVRPDPFTEWALGWLDRHPPRSNGREGPVVWDSGQFHHEHGHLTAIVDLELGHIGDPMMDLAGWRMRDSVLPFGNFSDLYDRYGELAGAPVDIDAVQRHHIFFTLSNQLAFSHAVKDPPPGSDFATNLQWCNETNLYVTEAIAEYLGVELPAVGTPEPRRSRVGPVHQHLVRSLRALSVDDEYVRHQVRINFRVAQHLARVEEIGDAVEEANLDDLQQLLGRRPDDWEQGDLELERFALADAASGEHDEALVALFHRRNLRAQMLNGPAGSAMARHNPIQRFDDRGDGRG